MWETVINSEYASKNIGTQQIGALERSIVWRTTKQNGPRLLHFYIFLVFPPRQRVIRRAWLLDEYTMKIHVGDPRAYLRFDGFQLLTFGLFFRNLRDSIWEIWEKSARTENGEDTSDWKETIVDFWTFFEKFRDRRNRRERIIFALTRTRRIEKKRLLTFGLFLRNFEIGEIGENGEFLLLRGHVGLKRNDRKAGRKYGWSDGRTAAKK